MLFLNKELINSSHKKLKYLECKFNEIKFSPYAKLLKNDENPISPIIKNIRYTKEQREIQISRCGLVYDANEKIIGTWDEEKQQPILEKIIDGALICRRIKINDKKFIVSLAGVVFDNESRTLLGVFDKKNNNIIFEDDPDDEDQDTDYETEEDESDNETIDDTQHIVQEETKHENIISKINDKTTTLVESNKDDNCGIKMTSNNAEKISIKTELREKIVKSPKKDEPWVRPKNYAKLYLPPNTVLEKTYKGVRCLVKWTGTVFKSYRHGKEITYKSLSNAFDEFLKTQGVNTRYNVWTTFKTLSGHSIDRLDLHPIPLN